VFEKLPPPPPPPATIRQSINASVGAETTLKELLAEKVW
jgi:hypothetical protein